MILNSSPSGNVQAGDNSIGGGLGSSNEPFNDVNWAR